jgi:hypothetical protein
MSNLKDLFLVIRNLRELGNPGALVLGGKATRAALAAY